MPSQDEIADQQNRLAVHRQTLAHYLNQQAKLGEYVPPHVAQGVRETREQIRRIKGVLAGWGAPAADHPDDDEAAVAARPRVFLSYKRNAPDESLALELYAALANRFEIFIDQSMLVGTLWAERIEAELNRADVLVALLSEQSVRSEMVLAEIGTAHQLGRATGRPIILPVRLSYRQPFEYPLSAYLDHIEWAHWDGPQDTQRLIESLSRGIIGQQPMSLAPAPALARATARAQATELLHPPRPIAQPARLELPEGTMDPESAFYVERSGDPTALETIGRQGVTITIKGPRQMGKSSLLIRVVTAARAAGKAVAFLDFQLFDKQALSSADRFFPQFCAWLSDELELPDRVGEYWSAPLGNSQRCTRYIGRYLLKELGRPLVLAMDEVESIFETDFRSDFFGMLRSWHNNRATTPIWKQLDLVLVTSTEPYQLIENLNQSPFNVGQVIELRDFTVAEASDLNRRHGAPLDAADEQRLYDLVGGHPYLLRRALYLLASRQIAAGDLFAKAITDRGPFGDHLRYHLFRLHNREDLVQGMRQVLRQSTCAEEEVFFRLHGAGLVRRDGRAVRPRCRLYADYFREHLAV